MRRSFVYPGVVLLGLAGCSDWPPPGRGGLAEFRPPEATAVHPEDPAQRRLVVATSRLQQLKEQGVGARYPGRVAVADQLLVRVRRALAAGLTDDTTVDLATLDAELDRLSLLQQHPPASAGRDA